MGVHLNAWARAESLVEEEHPEWRTTTPARPEGADPENDDTVTDNEKGSRGQTGKLGNRPR